VLAGRVPAADDVATTFSYTDANAKNVGVAGEFSNWTILPLDKGTAGKWSKTLHLKPGNYGYKLVINDSDWIFDPANPARKIVNDIENSALSVGGVAPLATGKVAVTFTYASAQAKSVHVAGDFNKWLEAGDGKINAKPEWALQNDGAGNWKLTTELPAGKYQFKYVLDGGGTPPQWVTAAGLPTSSEGNSLLELKTVAPATTPAQLPEGAKAVYFSSAGEAAAVAVAGEFNQWNTTANPLAKNKHGVWEVAVALKPGKYTYKFVVDGKWLQDSANLEKAEDGLGGFNSVKVVE
jgi:1,4-alpha-glucan branching enzyme